MSEVLVYLLTAMVAVAAGIAFSIPAAGVFRALAALAGALLTVAVIIAAFQLGAAAPWMGPIHALVAAASALLVSAAARAGEPVLATEPYWRRVTLILFQARFLRRARRVGGP